MNWCVIIAALTSVLSAVGCGVSIWAGTTNDVCNTKKVPCYVNKWTITEGGCTYCDPAPHHFGPVHNPCFSGGWSGEPVLSYTIGNNTYHWTPSSATYYDCEDTKAAIVRFLSDNFPIGSEITCYYDPGNPKSIATFGECNYVFYGLATFFGLAVIFCVVYGVLIYRNPNKWLPGMRKYSPLIQSTDISNNYNKNSSNEDNY